MNLNLQNVIWQTLTWFFKKYPYCNSSEQYYLLANKLILQIVSLVCFKIRQCCWCAGTIQFLKVFTCSFSICSHSHNFMSPSFRHAIFRSSRISQGRLWVVKYYGEHRMFSWKSPRSVPAGKKRGHRRAARGPDRQLQVRRTLGTKDATMEIFHRPRAEGAHI